MTIKKANPKRAERLINLNGKTYKCKMSLDAITKIEDAIDKSLQKILVTIDSGDLTAKQMMDIIACACVHDYDEDELKEDIALTGTGAVLVEITNMLLCAYAGLPQQPEQTTEKKSRTRQPKTESQNQT